MKDKITNTFVNIYFTIFRRYKLIVLSTYPKYVKGLKFSLTVAHFFIVPCFESCNNFYRFLGFYLVYVTSVNSDFLNNVISCSGCVSETATLYFTFLLF